MAKPQNPEVIITAGGTRESVDDVRFLGNISSGRFGHALAQEYASNGHRVTLLAPQADADRFGISEGIDHVPFTTGKDLREALLKHQAAGLILHAAAVSDYAPIRTTGKISSDEETLTIECVRTPKILSLLRGHFGIDTTIIGFKLLSGVTTDHLIDVATTQLAVNETTYCVANRLEDIQAGGSGRTVHLVDSLGISREISGSTNEVAKALYDAVQWRAPRNGQ